MIRKQPIPWLRIGAESTAIIVSILLAFSIDAWWTTRVERDLESQYLGRLLEEVSINATNLEFIVELAERKVAALATLDTILQQLGDSRSTAEAATAMQLETVSLGWALPGFTDVVFEELRSTGRLGLIRDIELRTMLVRYYQQIAHTVVRIENRRTGFAPYIYRLIPPEVLYGEIGLNGLAEIRLSAAIDTENFRQVLTAERNYAYFIGARMAALEPEIQQVEQALLKAAN